MNVERPLPEDLKGRKGSRAADHGLVRSGCMYASASQQLPVHAPAHWPSQLDWIGAH